MKAIALGFYLTCVALLANGQDYPSFGALRYNEDYSRINADSLGTVYAWSKHLPLWRRDLWLSFGGNVRHQFIDVENEDWGDTYESSDAYVLARYLVHVDMHAGKRWRTFVEFQSSLALDKRAASALDKNPLELHQCFVEYAVLLTSTSKLTLRLGRQEQLYGAQRLASVRNGPNNRQSFDGIKALYTSGDSDVDFFYEHFVVARPGSFNDSGEKAVRLWGAYCVKRNVPLLKNIDFYYLGLYKTLAGFDDGIGKETRHSVGTRIWKQTGALNFDIECLYQFGRLTEKSIRAWTASINTAYTFPGMCAPRIGVKTEIITGDRRYHDNTINTFNSLFPTGAYFGLAAEFGPSNLIDFHPSLKLSLSQQIEWNVDYDVFWRHSVNDGIYTNNGRLIYTGRNNPHRFIGSQFSTDFDFSLSRFFSFSADFKWFICGDFLKTAGEGEDILFAMLAANITF